MLERRQLQPTVGGPWLHYHRVAPDESQTARLDVGVLETEGKTFTPQTFTHRGTYSTQYRPELWAFVC